MFEDFEVVSSYSDANAVDDGVLVPVSGKNLMTRTVFEFLAKNTPLHTAEPPANWPVEMMGWFKSGTISKKMH